MTAAPRVSVIVPAFNAAQTIRETVDSILAQTVQDIEVIVVDDGSTDGTIDVVRGFGDERVRLVEQHNGGAAAARNTGIGRAAGTWVAFLDSDDLWLPEKLERQLAELERTGMDAALTSVVLVDANLAPLEVRHSTPSDDLLMDFLSFRNLPAVMDTLIVRRSRLEQVGRFSADLVILEDWDLLIRLARNGGVHPVTEPLALYRQHPGNRSRDLSIHIEPGFKVLGRLFADPTLPAHVRRRRRLIYGRFYAMLSGGAFKVRDWPEALRWGVRALRSDPRTAGYLLALPLRAVRRRLARRALARS